MTKITIGRPIIVGVAKEVNRFSFIFLLKVHYFLVVIFVLVLGSLGSDVWRFSVEI